MMGRCQVVLLTCGLAIAATGLAGCSSSSSPSASPSPAVTLPSPVASFSGPKAAICNALVEFTQTDINLRAAEQKGESLKVQAEQSVAALQEVSANLPSDATVAKAAVDAYSSALQQLSNVTVSPSAQVQQELKKASQGIMDYAEKECPTP